jgi:hypothetical protein
MIINLDIKSERGFFVLVALSNMPIQEQPDVISILHLILHNHFNFLGPFQTHCRVKVHDKG